MNCSVYFEQIPMQNNRSNEILIFVAYLLVNKYHQIQGQLSKRAPKFP